MNKTFYLIKGFKGLAIGRLPRKIVHMLREKEEKEKDHEEEEENICEPDLLFSTSLTMKTKAYS